VPFILGMSFLRGVKPQVDWAGSVVRVGKYRLPVCKFSGVSSAKSMCIPSKSRPSGCVQFSNTF
jgi:hypothetical protein